MATNEPNMNLILPTIGTDTGLTWEQSANANSVTVGGHTHAPGSGVQITPLGLNINTNLPINGNQITTVYGIGFSSPAPSTQTTFLYTNAQSGGGVTDLFFNDGAGNVIPITKAGIVNSTASSIPGESYGSGTFVWKQGAGSTTPANFDIGSVTLRPNTASTTNGITLSPPAGISSAYSLILPALPSVKSLLCVDTSGNILTNAPGTPSLNSVITISSAGVIGSQVVGNARPTGDSVVAGGVAISSSCGSFQLPGSPTLILNLGVTITTTGRPVSIQLISDGTVNSAIYCEGGSNALVYLQNTSSVTGTGTVAYFTFGGFTGSTNNNIPAVFTHIDFPPAGTNTYQFYGYTYVGSANTTQLNNVKVVAYEI